MLKKSFFLILLIFSNKIYTEDVNQNENSNSYEDNFNKEFYKSKKIGKTISIIVWAILGLLFICLIIFMIYKRNSFSTDDENFNIGITLFKINNSNTQNQNEEEINIEKIYIF